MLKNKNIIIGVTGGIAAYKIPLLVRELRKAGANVRIVMTEAAKEFVTPLTLSTLSNNEVIVSTFPQLRSNVLDAKTWHITLGQWADLMIIAPATANMLAKLAHGYSDDAVSTLSLAVRCPLVVAPTMDVDMWQHTTTQQNVATLQQMGCSIISPEEGELASGLVGPGRLPEIMHIVNVIDNVLDGEHKDLTGKKILITAGPTREAIDPVRYIGNRSSGKMGFALAIVAAQRGAQVTLITGKVHLPTPRNVNRIDVETAEQMYHAVMKHRVKADIIIMAAAVADFTPAHPSSKKIKKETATNDSLTLTLKKTKDILCELSLKKSNSVLVGFALETDNEIANAKRKLRNKNLDLMVLNNANRANTGLEVDTNIVTILAKKGKIQKLKKMSKFDVAREILNRVVRIT